MTYEQEEEARLAEEAAKQQGNQSAVDVSGLDIGELAWGALEVVGAIIGAVLE